uniref:Transporter n=1 Tax=Plectus sambesii TaxID=2011161 RepID=A0A914XN38_9BILA
MDDEKSAQLVPLTDPRHIPPLVDDIVFTDEKPPAYESLSGEEPVEGRVHFQRSQSLPQLSTERLRGNTIPRMRFLSGRASAATLTRMRNLSTRTFSVVGPNDENQARGNWDNPVEFFLSCLGYAVGLGNVWRFPYLCYRNGGGAFLIPYLIMLFGCGLPLLFMELALGQYSSEGPLTVWKLAPLFKGLGIGMVLCSVIMSVYYNMITGWAMYYLTVSIRESLPWTCCEDGWSSENCISFAKQDVCPARTGFQHITNQSSIFEHGSKAKFAADEFFHKKVLNMATEFSLGGDMQWHLVIALFAAWLIVFLVLMKGIKSFGKAVYFTSTFPYAVLLALLVRSLMEPGAVEGIKYYLRPNMTVLASPQVWGDAASQIFYSTGVCMGGAITLASYNKFKNNLYRDAVIVALGNSATSIFSGFVVFSILGFMAHSQNTTVDKVATNGPGLTFITYPQAVTILPWSPLWSALFFLMLIILALSSMFPTVENIATSLIDQWPKKLRPYKFWVMMAVCTTCFLLGLPLTTNAGMYLLQLLDNYGVSYALLILGLIEVTVVAWLYGGQRLFNNVHSMLGRRPSIIWKYIWMYVTPSLLIFAITLQIIDLKPIQYGSQIFPPYASKIGWCLTSISLLPIPIYAIYKLVCFKRSPKGYDVPLRRALVTLTAPAENWGPALTKYRCAGQQYDEDDVFA